MDFEKVDETPEPIGSYAAPIGPDVYQHLPVYDRRYCLLPVWRVVSQVRLYGFGGLFWINVDD